MGAAAKSSLRLVPGRRCSGQTPPACGNQLPVIDNREDFQRVFLPHLDAAYNLARWLVKNETDAQDVVQEAYLRALRFSQSFRGGNARAWLLAIVRNTAFTWMSRNRTGDPSAGFDEEQHADEAPPADFEFIRKADSEALRAALDELPEEFREMVVLRDVEGFSYKEIAEVADVPIGTVMSRLARARRRLKTALLKRFCTGGGQ